MFEKNDKLEMIETLRKKVSTLRSEKERLTGKIETQEKSLKDMEEECRKKFDCGIEELQNVADQLESEANSSLSEAKKILGL